MYHFFVPGEEIAGSEIRITGPDVNHIRNVLRMKPGERLCVGDGAGREYLCAIRGFAPGEVLTEILSQETADTELPATLILFQGLPKGDKMELIIQKAVELGAAGIVPVVTRRTIVKLDAKKAQDRVRRWNAVAQSAAKQSGRQSVPAVFPVTEFQEAVRRGVELDVKILPYENARGMEATREAVECIRPGTSAGIFIGPEGGFEDDEVRMALEAGWTSVSLGSRILRTETAGPALLSILMYHLETTRARQEK